MKMMISLLLIAVGVVDITLGITQMDARKRLDWGTKSLIWLCLFGGVYSIAFGMIGLQAEPRTLYVWRGIGFIGLFGFIYMIGVFTRYWTASELKLIRYFNRYTLLGCLLLFPIVSSPAQLELLDTPIGMYYTFRPFWGRTLYTSFLIGYILFALFVIAALVRRGNRLEYDRRLGEKLAWCSLVLLAGTIVDAMLPVIFTMPVYPISAMVVGVVSIFIYIVAENAKLDRISFETFNQYILTGMQTPILLVDLKGRISLANEFAAQYFDTPMNHLTEQKITALIQRDETAFSALPREMAYDVVTASGKECSIKLTPVYGASGIKIGEVVIFNDLTKENKMLREIGENRNEKIDLLQDTMFQSFTTFMEIRDTITGNHVKNTIRYAEIFLNSLGKTKEYGFLVTEEYKKNVLRSVSLHDMGKLGIDDSILRKEGPLTDDEFAQMRRHTVIGGMIFDQLLDKVRDVSFLAMAKNMSLYHHEKWNGAGYPYGIEGKNIPFESRIMAIVDVYEALTSERSYKKAFPHEKAMRIIREGAGTHFDPDLTEVFLSISEEIDKGQRRTTQTFDGQGVPL